VWEEDVSNVTVIPTQRRSTTGSRFRYSSMYTATSRRTRQLHLRKPQRVTATSVDAVVRTEMGDRIFLLKTAPKSACFESYGTY
jgi:hypothetical protein